MNKPQPPEAKDITDGDKSKHTKNLKGKSGKITALSIGLKNLLHVTGALNRQMCNCGKKHNQSRPEKTIGFQVQLIFTLSTKRKQMLKQSYKYLDQALKEHLKTEPG